MRFSVEGGTAEREGEEGGRYLTSLDANRNGIDNDESHQKPLEPVI